MKNIQINVKFYDKTEKDLIRQNYPTEFPIFSNLTINNIKVPFADFKTYCQFHHQDLSKPELEDFSKIQLQSEDLFGAVKFYTKYDEVEEKFTSKYDNANQINYVPESLGVGGILSVLSHAYGLTQADWKRIDVQKHKDFDFDSSVVKNFSKLIVVEAKGSIVPDNSLKPPTISNHKTRIKNKKKDKSFKVNYSNGVDLLIGGITIMDQKNHLKVLFVDPPSSSDLDDTFRRKIKIIKRMSFYVDWLTLISERSYLSLILANRLKALKILPDVRVLDGIGLTNSKDEPLKLNEQFIEEHSNINKEIIGRFEILDGRKGIFIGLPEDIYNIMASQEQKRLVEYKREPSYKNKDIDLYVSKKQVKNNQAFFSKAQIGIERIKKDFIKLKAKNVNVTESSSGLSFAVISPSNIEINE